MTDKLEVEFTQAMLAYITEIFRKHKKDGGILEIGEACRELKIRLSPAQLDMEREIFMRIKKAKADADNHR